MTFKNLIIEFQICIKNLRLTFTRRKMSRMLFNKLKRKKILHFLFVFKLIFSRKSFKCYHKCHFYFDLLFPIYTLFKSTLIVECNMTSPLSILYYIINIRCIKGGKSKVLLENISVDELLNQTERTHPLIPPTGGYLNQLLLMLNYRQLK